MRLIAPQVKIREYANFAGVAYLETASGVMLDTSNCVSASVNLFDLGSSTPSIPVFSAPTLQAANCMFDTRQVDGYATYLGDGDGYNFLYVLNDDDYHMQGGKTYRLEVILTTTGYGQVAMVWNISIGEMFS